MRAAGVATRHRVLELAERAQGRPTAASAADDRAAALIAELGAEIFREIDQDAAVRAENAQLEEECPVCFEALVTRAALPCGHALCVACLRSCWDVEQRAPATWKSKHLTCPLCRDSRPLAPSLQGLLDQATQGSGDSAEIEPQSGDASAVSIQTLSALELRVISGMLGIHCSPTASAEEEERSEIEMAISERLLAQSRGVREPLPPLAIANMGMLPAKCLKTILLLRDIPFDDCIEKDDFIQRVVDTPRGSCMKLSLRMLRKMLHDLGAAAETPLDKETLARRVMAARILRQRQRQQVRKSTIRSTSNWHSPNSKTGTRRPKLGAREGEQSGRREAATGVRDTTRRVERQDKTDDVQPAAAADRSTSEHRADDPEAITAARERLRRFEQLRMIGELQIRDRDIARAADRVAPGQVAVDTGWGEMLSSTPHPAVEEANGPQVLSHDDTGECGEGVGAAELGPAKSPRFEAKKTVPKGCTAGQCGIA